MICNAEDDETVSVVMWQVGGTDKAYLMSTLPKGDPKGKQIWLPRSQITHISRGPEIVGQWQRCVVTMKEWLANKHQL